MRDLLAGVIAIALLLFAASLATTLRLYRKRRERERDSERALGRAIVTEIPGEHGLVLFSEDAKRFYYGDQGIDKDLVTVVRVLINGATIATHASRRHERDAARSTERTAPTIDDRPEGIARDRWDVAIETLAGTTIVECGSIRERVSQELARAVFDAVTRDLDARDLT